MFIPFANSGEYKHATGFGIQYGGLVGYQLSYKESQSNFRGAVGLGGGSVGYDYLIADSFSLGATYTVSVRNVTSLNFNYMPSGNLNRSWIFGIDLAHIDGQKASGDGFFRKQEKDSKNIIFFSVGYKF